MTCAPPGSCASSISRRRRAARTTWPGRRASFRRTPRCYATGCCRKETSGLREKAPIDARQPLRPNHQTFTHLLALECPLWVESCQLPTCARLLRDRPLDSPARASFRSSSSSRETLLSRGALSSYLPATSDLIIDPI